MFFFLKRHNSENKTDAQLNSPWNKILFRISPWYWNRSRSAIVQSRLAAFVSVHLHTYYSLATVASVILAWVRERVYVTVYVFMRIIKMELRQNGYLIGILAWPKFSTIRLLILWYYYDFFSLLAVWTFLCMSKSPISFSICDYYRNMVICFPTIYSWKLNRFLLIHVTKNDVFCILNSIWNTFGLFWMISVAERMRWTAAFIFDSIKLICVFFYLVKIVR